uniref:Uncharacterized protein n=1 Tax=Neobodo designis TaxID=312471 RepID=A0A6U4V2G9_NEODS|mmetsp:Transcript_43701/g.134949  ORF Transcript_43701/g.134949 Transcript_43701/m.134949 type:complete len:123 (+) Transcript_43701:3-371(+)
MIPTAAEMCELPRRLAELRTPTLGRVHEILAACCHPDIRAASDLPDGMFHVPPAWTTLERVQTPAASPSVLSLSASPCGSLRRFAGCSHANEMSSAEESAPPPVSGDTQHGATLMLSVDSVD